MNELDFVKLAKHLEEIIPICIQFADREGFKLMHTDPHRWPSLGRYPSIRMVKYIQFSYFISVSMDNDEKGQYFDEFFPEIPYSLHAGVWYDVGKTRNSLPTVIGFQRVPFIEVKLILDGELSRIWNQVKDTTLSDLVVQSMKL